MGFENSTTTVDSRSAYVGCAGDFFNANANRFGKHRRFSSDAKVGVPES
jgi:hypothetical protein